MSNRMGRSRANPSPGKPSGTSAGRVATGNASYETGARGGTFRMVNGKKIYGRLKPRQAKVGSPNGDGHSINNNNTSKGIPSQKKTLQGMPAVTGHEPKPVGDSPKKKGFKDHVSSIAGNFIPKTASGRVSLVGRMARLGMQAASVHASSLNSKYPGAGGALKKWAVKKAVGYAMNTVGNHVAGQVNDRVGAALKKRYGGK